MQHVSNNASTFAPFFLRRLLSSFTRRGAVTARSSRQFGTSSPMISLAQAPFWYVPPPCFRWCTLLFSLCLLHCAISAGRAPFFDAVSKNMENPIVGCSLLWRKMGLAAEVARSLCGLFSVSYLPRAMQMCNIAHCTQQTV